MIWTESLYPEAVNFRTTKYQLESQMRIISCDFCVYGVKRDLFALFCFRGLRRKHATRYHFGIGLRKPV
jgi:hypothetical protein